MSFSLKNISPWFALIIIIIGCQPLEEPIIKNESKPFGFSNSLKLGNYQVGFSVDYQYDSLRIFQIPDSLDLPNNYRPMPIAIWYPANPNPSTKPIAYKSYVHEIGKEEIFTEPTTNTKHHLETNFINSPKLVYQVKKVKEEVLKSYLDTTTIAFRDAPPILQKFPTIIYAAGNDPGGTYGSAMENSILFEYLASHGYIIIALPSYAGRTFTKADIGVQEQVDDLVFLMDYALKHPQVDTLKIATMGASWGGVSQSIFCANNPRIKAFISLEGGVIFQQMYDRLQQMEQFHFVKPATFKFPILNIASAPLWQTRWNWNMTFCRSFVDSIPNDSYLLKFKETAHRNVMADQIITMTLGVSEQDSIPLSAIPFVRKTVEEKGYDAMAYFCLQFLETYLNENKIARDFLQIEDNWKPFYETILEVEFISN